MIPRFKQCSEVLRRSFGVGQQDRMVYILKARGLPSNPFDVKMFIDPLNKFNSRVTNIPVLEGEEKRNDLEKELNLNRRILTNELEGYQIGSSNKNLTEEQIARKKVLQEYFDGSIKNKSRSASINSKSAKKQDTAAKAKKKTREATPKGLLSFTGRMAKVRGLDKSNKLKNEDPIPLDFFTRKRPEPYGVFRIEMENKDELPRYTSSLLKQMTLLKMQPVITQVGDSLEKVTLQGSSNMLGANQGFTVQVTNIPKSLTRIEFEKLFSNNSNVQKVSFKGASGNTGKGINPNNLSFCQGLARLRAKCKTFHSGHH